MQLREALAQIERLTLEAVDLRTGLKVTSPVKGTTDLNEIALRCVFDDPGHGGDGGCAC